MTRFIVALYAGGRSQRDLDYGLEKALGQVVLSTSPVREVTETVRQECEACQPRDCRGDEVADLLMEAGFEPLRRCGRRMGVRWGGGDRGGGAHGPAHSLHGHEGECCALAGGARRELLRRGLRPPGTLPTEGAGGLTTAIAAIWPHSRRRRCWVHPRQNLQPQGSPQVWPEVNAVGIDRRAAPRVPEAARRRQE